MEHLPEHCQGCSYFLYKMGSCPYPGVSFIYSALSVLPYLAAFAVGGLALIRRRLSLFAAFFIVASCYILTDAYLKNIFLDPRPTGACKRSYGMPSSHMVVTAIFATLITIRNPKDVYIAAAISILEGLARYQLRYHTVLQILAGEALGIIYCLAAVKYFNSQSRLLRGLHSRFRGLIKRVPFLIDDIAVEETPSKDHKD